MTRSVDLRLLLLGLLVVAGLTRCVGPEPAYADDTRGLLPAGTVVERPTGERTVLPAPRNLIDRGQMDKANACARSKADTERRLTEALTAAAQVRDPEPSWVTAVKWGAVGGAIVGAFAAGAVLF